MFLGSRFAVDTEEEKWLLSSLSKWWWYLNPGRLFPETSTACSHWLSLRAECEAQLLVYCRGLGFPINCLIQSGLVSQSTCIHTPWHSSHSGTLPNTPCAHWTATCTGHKSCTLSAVHFTCFIQTDGSYISPFSIENIWWNMYSFNTTQNSCFTWNG